MKPDKQDNPFIENDNSRNEPKVENDYSNRTEIEAPNPSTATPPIPNEMPPR